MRPRFRLVALLPALALGFPLMPAFPLAIGRGADETRQEPQTPPSPAGETGWEINDALVRCVERGLAWLASHQQLDGSWKGDVGFKLNNGYELVPEGEGRGHVGVTALAGMAFLANGQRPGRGRYGEVVDRALDYVLSCVQDNGFISSNGTRMYSHAFATLFLAEIVGMVRRDDVREKLEDAIRLIVDSQNGEGGWRYVPFARESDMSITVCQVMALRAARNVGIPVPRATIERAVGYVKESKVGEGPGGRRAFPIDTEDKGAFRYQRQHFSRASFSLTAAGVVTLYGAGVYADRDIELGLDYLERHLEEFSAEWGENHDGHYFFYYGHYYAVQAMYVALGPRWRRYFEHVRGVLLRMQDPKEGSWPNRYGPGPAFSTAVATLILQIPYRYLPIFQR
jgi:prenyltransferase/squalene oxidase-like repeat protein